MNPTLRDICKDAKIRKGITTQKLSDETGISISTINNFFATASKSPSVYNAGDICAVLGYRWIDISGSKKMFRQKSGLKKCSKTEKRS